MEEKAHGQTDGASRQEEERTIGKYGWMHERFLKEHRPEEYRRLVETAELTEYLLDIQETATNRLRMMMPYLAAEAGATEQLKRTDQLKWVGLMNNCKAQAEEIIFRELIYV